MWQAAKAEDSTARRGARGWRDWEGDQAVKGEGEEEKQGREGVYNFGKRRERKHWEQTFLSHFHISSKL